MLKDICIFTGNHAQIEEVYPAYAFVVIGFLRIFSFNQRPAYVFFYNRFKGYRFAVIIPLEFRTPNFLQEPDLRRCFHPFTDGVYPQRCRHPHQLGQDNPSAFSLIQFAHETHIKLDQVELDAL